MYLGHMYNLYRDFNKKSLCLFDLESKSIFFEQIPKYFTISTKFGSSKFNIEMLLCTSPVIFQFLKENPNNFNYHLKIVDKMNVLGKFEQLYEGKTILIEAGEKNVYNQIKSKLRISSDSFLTLPNENSYSNEASISLQKFSTIVQTNFPFIIKTNKNEYKCNLFGIYSSSVISEFVKSNSQSKVYFYDFPDEFDEFQQICDFFNFKKIILTTNNMKSIKKIANELNITILINQLGSILEDYDKFSQKLDEKHDSIGEISDLFDLLQNIDKITVNSVKNSIIESKWCETKENVQELAAFILKSIDLNLLIHQHLIDLLIELNSESTKLNELKILIPFIKNKLKQSFGSSIQNCSFVYKLYKRGIISKKFIEKKLKSDIVKKQSYSNLNTELNFQNIFGSDLHNNEKVTYIKTKSQIILWFLPEILELENNQLLIDCQNERINSFINFYMKNIDIYKKMRDNGEPIDEITLALRYDDVDKFQSIISVRNEKEKNTNFVPVNIFEEFVPNGETNYLNYSAAYGSIKCFKYLFLNHAELNNSSFYYAIYGGNIEIIKIIDQQNMLPCSKMSEAILCAVKKHKDDLFDWIFEQKYNGNNTIQLDILIEASINGNIHSVASIIDKGFDFFDLNENKCKSIIENASKNGFYKFLQFVFIFTKEVIEKKCFNKSLIYNPESSVYFGNISILKFYHEQCDHFDIIKAISIAINYEQAKIIEYICDHYDKELNSFLIRILLPESLRLKTNKIFVYLINKFKNYISDSFTSIISDLRNLLSQVCYSQNFEIAKIIIDLILEQNNNMTFDFAFPFLNAAVKGSTEICQFMIDKKCFINYEVLSLQKQELIHIKKDILCNIIQNMTLFAKEILINCYLIDAIKAKYIFLIEYLLNEDAKDDFSLIEAVKTQDIEIVNMILNKNSEPSFVNKLSEDGTALNIAVSLNQLDIVKRLLSIPGIDPSLFGKNKQTPLVTSISKLNFDIFNAILDFYGTSINSQQFQLDEAVNQLSTMLLNTNGPL